MFQQCITYSSIAVIKHEEGNLQEALIWAYSSGELESMKTEQSPQATGAGGCS